MTTFIDTTSIYDRRKASIRGYIMRELKRNKSLPLRDVVAWAKARLGGIEESELVYIVKRVLEGTARRRSGRKGK